MSDAPKCKRKRSSTFSPGEKRKRRKALIDTINASRIVIKEQFGRWRALKNDQQLKTDADTAKFLLE